MARRLLAAVAIGKFPGWPCYSRGERSAGVGVGNSFSAESFAAMLALVGAVIIVASLLSGFVERSGVPQVAVFLLLGLALGPAGLGVLNLALDSPAVRVVATLSLVLVLFTDALTLDVGELRRHGFLALLVLGPGTLLSAALVALAGWGILGLAPAAAAILGAALASTDPVLLRGLLRRRDIPAAARVALRLESGLNDVVLLPIVLVAMAFLAHNGPASGEEWARLAIDLFLLGPGAGVGIGLLAIGTLDLVRRRVGVRRDYESLYSLGVAFAAFAAAEAVHGSGFLAAFAAGLTISALDVELCDCFFEYGETTAEMALLFTFVLFGGSLIWSGLGVLGGATLLFALLTLLLRPVVYLVALLPATLSRRSRVLIAWFGPRGLSSLLLALLPVFAGVPGGAQIFALCCLVVLFSIVVHGSSPLVLSERARRHRQETGEERAGAVAMPPVPADGETAGEACRAGAPGAPAAAGEQPEVATPPMTERDGSEEQARADGEVARPSEDRISVDELRALQRRGEPVVVLDVRTDRTYGASEARARGAVRMRPTQVAEQAAELGLPRQAWLVAYCA